MRELTDITPQTITLKEAKEAMDAVASWPDGFGFHLHRIARTLYDEVCRLRREVNELNVDRHNQAEAIRQERAEVDRLTEELRQTSLRLADAEAHLDAMKAEADHLLHVATCQRDDSGLLKTMAEYNDKLAAERDMAQREHARVQDGRQGIISQMIEFRDDRDTMRAAYAKLEYQMRTMGLSLTGTPDGYMCRKEQYTVEGIIDLMDGWRDDVECWGLHQMCRVLREAYEGQRENFGNALKEWNRWEREATANPDELLEAARYERDNLHLDNDRLREDLSNLQRTFDLRWDADRRAIKRWQVAHPGNDLVWPDHADMVVWLLGGFDWWRKKYERHRRAHWSLKQKALSSIPCAMAKDDCPCPDYRWAPCCNLRVALWPGEEFPTDYLMDSGEIHLFHLGTSEYPRAPLASAGCVKLIEPMTDEDRQFAHLDALEGALNLSCTET